MEVSLVIASSIPVQRVQHLTEVEKNEMVINGDVVLLTRSESISPVFQVSISPSPHGFWCVPVLRLRLIQSQAK